MPGVCGVCFRKEEWSRLSPAEQEGRIVAVVHERYRGATMETLPEALRTQLLAAPQNETIYLCGPAGTGKTWSLAALARAAMRDGFWVERETWERLGLRIRDTFNPKATQTEWSVIEPLLTADKLIIEDIGTTVSIGRQESDFGLRTLLVILDSRSEDCLPTWLTGNKSVAELGKSFDSRIASRIHQGTIIHKSGKDRRKREE